jgi:uncharacterized lipoprotein YddW (UPF0748 family)
MSKLIKKIIVCVIALLCCNTIGAQQPKKYEFRGVWIHTLNGDYQGKTEAQFKAQINAQLDKFKQVGINAIIFQIRPEADALYASKLEPWSRFLSGIQGVSPGWDPLPFVIDACHERGMEFHAWINPYRVTLDSTETLAHTHIYYQHPEWFVKYGKQIFFNPGIPECRKFINDVVRDIVSRYDVDAIHMDDYFYPYPVGGQEFPDEATFQKYGVPAGFAYEKGNWRRENVNKLISEISQTIRETKPWVKFGVSPFGIYRNKKDAIDGIGSDTNGLQCYDQLYADVLLWMRNRWVDYVIPQLYWNIGTKVADYTTLINWWAAYSYDCPLYIGQDFTRTVSSNQMDQKLKLSSTTPNVSGNCFFSGHSMLEDPVNLKLLGERHYNTPAIVPPMAKFGNKTPNKIRGLKAEWTDAGYLLLWIEPKAKTPIDSAKTYVVYSFGKNEKVNLDDPTHIMAITTDCFYRLPYVDGKTKYKYVVTALNRLHNESKNKSKKVKL